jgi:predicted alpha/beta hydrolase family esterase
MKRLLPAVLLMMLSGCISGIDYGKIPHAQLSAGSLCNPKASDTIETDGKPFFLVTSRLPDCQNASPVLTDFRTERLRYGKFGAPIAAKIAKTKAALNPPLAFQPDEIWWTELQASVKASNGHVLLYVHGFRETFRTSSIDVAQIANLTEFPGPVIQYSWPSQGELLSYVVDETNMSWDERNFRMFLQTLAEKPWVKDIVLVSHSLGARLIIPAIAYVDSAASNQDASNISRIILSAPDTDRGEFERDIGRQILSAKRVQAGRRLTVYVSANDKAIALSRTIHGYPRLGNPFCFDRFEAAALRNKGLPERCYPINFRGAEEMDKSGLTIIDTSDVSVGRSGHSDYLRSAAACKDFAGAVAGKSSEYRVAGNQPYVYLLKPYGKDEKPAHDDICKRAPR